MVHRFVDQFRAVFIISLLVVFTIILLLPFEATAASELKCLAKSKGKIITWRADWQKDNRDGGVRYQVVSVKVVNKIPDRIVTLQLKAVSSRAKIKRRTVRVDAEDTARSYCRRLSNPLVERKKPPQPPPQAFIHYTIDGWVRADPPRNKGLSECRVLRRVFLCTKDDKQRYSSALKQVEEELLWQVQ